MSPIIVLVVILGVVLMIGGAINLIYPNLEWKLSIARALYLKGGEPTQLYYTMKKVSGVITLIIGFVMIAWGFIHGFSGGNLDGPSGFKVYVDKQELVLPCTYADIEEIGFEPCAGEEFVNLPANDTESIKVKNSKGEILTIYFRNKSGEEKPMKECEVYKLHAEYKVQTYEFHYNTGDDLVNGNYYTTIGYTDAEEGPHIRLDNGFSSNSTGDSAEDILGKGSTGVTGNYRKYTVWENSDYINMTVGFDGLSWDDEISFITIEYP